MTCYSVGDSRDSLVGRATTPVTSGEGQEQGLSSRQGEGKWWAPRLFCGRLCGCQHHLMGGLLLKSGQTYVYVCTTTNTQHMGTCLVALFREYCITEKSWHEWQIFQTSTDRSRAAKQKQKQKQTLMPLMVLLGKNICHREIEKQRKEDETMPEMLILNHIPPRSMALLVMLSGSETSHKV